MKQDDWLLFPRTAVAAAVAVVAAAVSLPVLAQNTTSAVSGRVVGNDGRPVAGATVTIVHTPSGTTVNATTDSEGRYAARGLRAGGPYSITFQRGNDIDRRSDVNLALAETLTLDGLLGVSAQTVTVTGRSASARFDRGAMGAGTQIGQRELNALASIQRNLQDYARTDPRLAQTDKERGEISAGGQNTRYNSITVDGVTINDTFGLESNNLPTLKQPISIDAIQTVQVNISNYDVTQKGYTGANINAVTKSGTNVFSGSIFHVRRDDNLVGDRFNRTTGAYLAPPSFEETTNGFTLGGPIIKDKLFFFAAYEELASSRTSPDFGPIGSGRTNVGITTTAIQGAREVAASTYPSYVVGSPDVPTGTELTVKDTLLKLDWNITDAHRASLRYTKTEQNEPIFPGFGIRSLSLNSHFYSQAKEIETIVAQWFGDWTPTFSTEFKYSTRDYTSAPNNNSRQPYVNLSFSGALPPGTTGVATGTRGLNIGTERFRHFNELATDTTDLYLGATWTLGDHELKFGVDRQDNEIFNAFVSDSLGNYTFACENGTYAGIGTVNCATADAATIEAVVLARFRAGTPSSYLVAAPLSGFTLNDAAATWKLQNTGLFLQDSWNVSKTFTLMAGVRLDQQSTPSRPVFNPAVAAAPGFDSATGRATGGFGLRNDTTIDGEQLIQPRLGFNWKIGGDARRMQLRGGLGLFQGAAAAVWLSNPFSNAGNVVTTYSCNNATACGTVRFSPNPATQPTVGGTGAVNVDLVAPGLEQPSVWKMNLAYDMELPELPVVGRTVLGAEWLHTRNAAALHYTHLNLGAPVRTGPDGRQLFYSAQAYDPACWTAGGARVTTCSFDTRSQRNRAFNDVVLASKTDKGRGDSVTVSLASADNRAPINWSVAYTMSRMTEVNPLTSSRAISNWNGRNSFNPNEEVASNSNYLIKDRFNASMSWSKAFFGTSRTTVGVFYEGRRGKPYSWTYINDLNGDGVGGNDLMYIPSAPGSGEVVFRGGAAEEARFWAVVDANPELAGAKGGVVGRNTSFNPWVNNVDMRLSQEVPGFTKSQKGSITLDILNVGNLLNKEWGRIDEIGFPSNRSFVNYVGLDPASGKYVYSVGSTEDFVTRQTAGESQWAVQLTLRYSF
jgi:Carboxypeptidase regulatory-like domain/TonB dependent receptor